MRYEGRYLNLEEMPDGDLRITVTPEGREEITEMKEKWLSEWAIMSNLLEDHFGNGWDEVQPEEVGALTSAMLISNTVVRNDDGDLVSVERIYWDPNYQVRSTVETLAKKGSIIWQGVGEEV